MHGVFVSRVMSKITFHRYFIQNKVTIDSKVYKSSSAKSKPLNAFYYNKLKVWSFIRHVNQAQA